MFVKIRRRHHANHTYEYVDIVESVRIDGRVVRRRLGTLGQRQDLPPHKIDALIEHLRKLASPEVLRCVRLADVLSRPRQMVFYALPATYFEGGGVCELAEYGSSRDHRGDRAQVVVGLAITQQGLPITHRIFPGSTVDVTTLEPMAEEL